MGSTYPPNFPQRRYRSGQKMRLTYSRMDDHSHILPRFGDDHLHQPLCRFFQSFFLILCVLSIDKGKGQQEAVIPPG